MIWLIALGVLVWLAICGLIVALCQQAAASAKDSALRCGVTVVIAQQAARRAEEAAGLVPFPEGRRR